MMFSLLNKGTYCRMAFDKTKTKCSKQFFFQLLNFSGKRLIWKAFHGENAVIPRKWKRIFYLFRNEPQINVFSRNVKQNHSVFWGFYEGRSICLKVKPHLLTTTKILKNTSNIPHNYRFLRFLTNIYKRNSYIQIFIEMIF